MAKPPFRETKLWMLILSPLLAASKKNYLRTTNVSFLNRAPQPMN